MANHFLRPPDVPSLSVAQGELARFTRTGSLLHLAHASRALEEALKEVETLRQRACCDKLRDWLKAPPP
jgi:hypothetical protein